MFIHHHRALYTASNDKRKTCREDIYDEIYTIKVAEGHLFGSQDAAEALRLLAAGPRMTADLDEHIGLRDVNAVVSHFTQEQRVDLQAPSAQAVSWDLSSHKDEARGSTTEAFRVLHGADAWAARTADKGVGIDLDLPQQAGMRMPRKIEMEARTEGLCLKAWRMRVRSAWLVAPYMKGFRIAIAYLPAR